MQELRPTAQAVYANSALGVFESWRRAFLQRGKSNKWLKQPKEGALHQALIRFGALNGSTTSGVEQAFGKQTQLFGKQRGDLNVQTENHENILYLDSASIASDDRLCNTAGHLWDKLRFPKLYAAHYAAESSVRISRGRKRKAKEWLQQPSFKGWREKAHKKLRKEVRNKGLKDTSTLEKRLVFPRDHAGWTAKHEEERAFQQSKLNDKKMEASFAGQLLTSEEAEVSPDKPSWLRKKTESKKKELLKQQRLCKLDMRAPRTWSLRDIVRHQACVSKNRKRVWLCE